MFYIFRCREGEGSRGPTHCSISPWNMLGWTPLELLSKKVPPKWLPACSFPYLFFEVEVRGNLLLMYLPADSQRESMLGVQSDLKLSVCISPDALYFVASCIDLLSIEPIANLCLRFPLLFVCALQHLNKEGTQKLGLSESQGPFQDAQEGCTALRQMPMTPDFMSCALSLVCPVVLLGKHNAFYLKVLFFFFWL